MASESTINPNLETILREHRVFPPPEEFAKQAHIKSLAEYQKMYQRSVTDPEGFWADAARELHWFRPWTKVLDWNLPWAKWFVGGRINLCYNCVDRHVMNGLADKTAILWEGEPGEVRKLTFGELHAEVQKFANVLKGLGIKKGDRVAVYMGMTPELAIAILACARIGAVHSVIFGGFAANAIVDRVNDSQCVAILTQDTSYRRGNEVKLKATVDEAVGLCPTVKNVVVYRRSGSPVNLQAGRDHWWHELVAKADAECPAEELDSEDPLYILYTSGTTGKPKGLVHTTGGYAVQTYLTSKYIFDLREDDVYWCTADIGWVTGHSYVVYGILQNGATTVMYEGAPNYPGPDRFWQLIDDHKVTVFYTAPTAIRAFIKWGDEYPARHDLNTLRLLGTVGEPINPEAWIWYREVIGHGRCPIVDTWWQTETGGIMISPIPGAVATKPGSATRPFFGVVPAIVSLALLGLRDKTIFLAARGEHYWLKLLVFLFPFTDQIAAFKIIMLGLWWGAATSKLNHHFPYVVAAMISNNALLRGRAFNWLKRMLYRDPVNDLRPTWIPKFMAHVGGTTAEFIVPAVLVFFADSHPWRWWLIGFMVIFHLNIISNLPMGVPLEWNVFFIFSLFYLFGHYGSITIYDLNSPLLLAFLMAALVVVPIVGNVFPQQISFLPALRYYAGNWASSVWCFRAGAEEKLDAGVIKSSALTANQLAKLYDPATAEIMSDKARAFRSMHVHGRALNGLVPRALGEEANEADYTFREGELVAGSLIGWNFGEGHLHNEQLLEAVQRRCNFDEGDLRVIILEGQPIQTQRQWYRIVDAKTGLIEEGYVTVADMLARQPWPEPDDEFPVHLTTHGAGAPHG